MKNDKTALDALEIFDRYVMENDDGQKTTYGILCVLTQNEFDTIRNKLKTRPQPCGDAVQVWVVYKVEDDSHHIFSTKEKAENFSKNTIEPTVIYDYIVDHPERYCERTN